MELKGLLLDRGGCYKVEAVIIKWKEIVSKRASHFYPQQLN